MFKSILDKAPKVYDNWEFFELEFQTEIQPSYLFFVWNGFLLFLAAWDE